MKDGIYFEMEESDYHKLDRLSASGIKEILVSIPTYWANSSMNPDKEEDEKPHFILGHAYHAAIFEPESFDLRFVPEVDPLDYPDALMTDAAVKRELRERGLTQAKQGELALTRALRLMEDGYDGEIWSLLIEQWEAYRVDRQPISAGDYNQIMRDIKRIESNPEIHDLVDGGASEVTILWTDPETNIRFKARIDKLKENYFVDLKSFVNKMRKPVNRCIIDQIMYDRHYLQARLYQKAIAAIGLLGLPVIGIATDREIELAEKLRASPKMLRCWFLYQEKGGIPNIIAREFELTRHPEGHEVNSIGADDYDPTNDSAFARKADIEIEHAKKLYLAALDAYGEDSPWFPFDMMGVVRDDDFSDWFLDREVGK